jgi:hypothetical protein
MSVTEFCDLFITIKLCQSKDINGLSHTLLENRVHYYIACLGAWIIIVNGREIINVKVKTLKLLRLRVLDFRFLYIVYVVRFFILAFHC